MTNVFRFLPVAGALVLAGVAKADSLRDSFPTGSATSGPWRLGWQVGPTGPIRGNLIDVEKSVFYYWSADAFEVFPRGTGCPGGLRVGAPPSGFWTTAGRKTGEWDGLPGPVGQIYIASGPCNLHGLARYTTPSAGRRVIDLSAFVAFTNDVAEVRLSIVGGPTLFTGLLGPDASASLLTTIDLPVGARIDFAVGNGDSNLDFVGVELRIDAVPAADVSGDGAVGAADIAELLGSWGACGGGHCPADLDLDGAVGAADLAMVLGGWGG